MEIDCREIVFKSQLAEFEQDVARIFEEVEDIHKRAVSAVVDLMIADPTEYARMSAGELYDYLVDNVPWK